METVVGINWDGWREQYPYMTFHDQQLFYRKVAEEHPEQQHFDLAEAEAAFLQIDIYGFTVVELGGWDGCLASKLLPEFPIVRWTNYDITRVPQVCTESRYKLHVLDDWFWNLKPRTADVFVATHMIEHITGAELAELFDCLDVEYIYLESPLTVGGQDWSGYRGTHILELGWQGVVDLLEARGYELIRPGKNTCLWKSP